MGWGCGPSQGDLMYNDMTDELQISDFDEFSDLLLEQGLQVSPSELHGCVCGLLAAGAATDAEAGLAALHQALNIELHGELAGQVLQLYAVSSASLLDEEFDFYPLLPDDECEIAERTIAMAGWCRGFLAGYAQVSADAGRAPLALPEDSNEILSDFAAIAEAEAAEIEDEEDAENHYAELLEYIRFAALNVFMDRGVPHNDDDNRPAGKPSLH